jgi:hypothetical protein
MVVLPKSSFMAHILYKYGKTSMNPVAIAAGNGGG